MASDVSPSQGSNRSVQDDFDRRREELKEDHERRLQQIEEGYQQRESDALKTGNATVNHIKKATGEEIEQTRSETNAVIEVENEKQAKTYENLKRRNHQETKVMDRELQDKTEQTQEQIHSLNDRQGEAIKKYEANMSDYARQENKRREVLRSAVNSDLDHLQTSNTEKTRALKAKNADELEKVSKSQQQKMAQLQDDSKTSYDHARSADQVKVERLKTQTSDTLKRDTDQYNSSSTKMREHYQAETTSERAKGEAKIADIEKNNQQHLHKLQEDGAKTEHLIMNENVKEINRVQTEGEKHVHDIQENNQKTLKLQDAQYQQEVKAEKSRYETEIAKQQKGYEEKKTTEGLIQNSNLQQQRKSFSTRFENADQANKDSLQTQKNGYYKELYKQKVAFDQKAAQFETRKEDPFYSSRNFQPSLEESDTAYTFKAQAPSADPESLDIRVKGDKILMSSARRYEDRLALQGETVTTNNYQTQRQEFKLDVPVDRNAIKREHSDDGMITITIPKKGAKV